MINLSDLEILDGKPIYDTNNDTYVVYEDKETILNSTDYKLLGFLNGYSYANNSGYLLRSTSYGAPVHEIFLDVNHGTFIEGMSYAYFWKDKTMYKINEMMEIEWEILFDDYIRQVIMDMNGNTYTIFKNSRTIWKYNKDGKAIYYINDSDDPTHYCRLYCGFVSEGGGHLYVTGVDFFGDGQYIAYVDHYDARRGKRIERMIKNYYDYGTAIEVDDPRYSYNDIYVDGDYVYLYGRSYIEKLNIRMRLIWRFYPYGFDTIGTLNGVYQDSFHEIVFDNRRFKDRIYFCTSIDVNNRKCSFGKLSTNGTLKWQIIDKSENPLDNVEFNVCVYNDEIYVTAKRDMDTKSAYVLSLDENRVLFETRDGELLKVIQYNTEELYGSENYIGRYTLADFLKSDISKTIDTPILHDTGEILTEDGVFLIVAVGNPALDDPDSYDTAKLIGSIPTSKINHYSVINTRYGLFLMTKDGYMIKSRYAYEPEQEVEYIVDDENRFIDNMDGRHLIRNRTIGTIYFYILNDEYKYGQDIITKKDGLTIITKRKGHSIIRKKRYAYRYIQKKLIDIDIIVEHLKQNNILDTLVPIYVDKLRHHTVTYIEDMQKCLSPVLFDLGYCKRFSYRYDGYDYPIRFSNTQIFMCNNIPYIDKRKPRSLMIEPMTTLVANQEVQPFLIFIDGKVVKWSDMTIVRDWEFSYIILSNTPENNDKIDSILLPCVVRYGEDNKIIPSLAHLYFNSDGLLTEDPEEVAIRIEITDAHVNGETIISSGYELEDENNPDTMHNTIIDIPVRDYDQWSYTNNLFVFNPDGRFFADSRFYLTNYGENMYSYEFDELNTIYKTFYFIEANDSKGMIYDIPNQEQVKYDLRKKYIPSNSIPEDSFKTPFDFKLSRDKSYLSNISEATRYIMGYNMGLLVDYYRNQSNIKSFTFTGRHILHLSSKYEGHLYMPRQRTNGLFDYVLVFVNDRLYEYMHEIIYKANGFYLPIFDHVKDDDKVEILHFKNVDNSYMSLNITQEPDYIGEKLRYGNFLLFGNSESGRLKYEDFDKVTREQYLLNFDFKNSFSEYGKYLNTSIELEDFYYYGKSVNVCSKRQFHGMYYKVIDYKNEFDLDPSFKFCHFTNQYMIFVDGRKLTQDEWQLIAPTHSNPRDRISIRLNYNLMDGQYIHIYYIPDPYEEITMRLGSSVNPNARDIIMDTSNLDYSFDNELFLIFINGHKVIKDNVQNISSNRVRIKNSFSMDTNSESKKVCICKYLDPDKILQKVFSYGDVWSKSVDGLTKEDYEQLFVRSGIKK